MHLGAGNRKIEISLLIQKISGKSRSEMVKSIIIQAKSDMLDNHNLAISKDFQEKIPELI